RPQTADLPDYRGYTGRVIGGDFRVGDRVAVLPSGFSSEITRIEIAGKPLEVAENGTSVVIHLADDIDISRGDLLAKADEQPVVSQEFEADICWMDTKPLDINQMYFLQQHGKVTKVKLQDVIYKINVNTLEKSSDGQFGLNDIGRVQLKTANPIAF